APQAELRTIDGYQPVDLNGSVVPTGLDFDAATFLLTGASRMRAVPDGVGTGPIGVRLSPDGLTAYVANYLARNVVPMATADPVGIDERPVNLRCVAEGTPGAWAGPSCATANDCDAARGACAGPGGAACAADADCGQGTP